MVFQSHYLWRLAVAQGLILGGVISWGLWMVPFDQCRPVRDCDLANACMAQRWLDRPRPLVVDNRGDFVEA